MRFENILSLLMVMWVLFVSISAISAQDTNDTLAIDNVLDDELSEGDLSYYVSNDGSDDNDGSLNSPYKTIGKATGKSDSNKTTNIYLSDGVYQQEGNVNLTVNGNVNLIGSSSEKTILRF